MNSSLDHKRRQGAALDTLPHRGRGATCVLWIVIGAFTSVQGIWAVCVGLSIRSDMWPNTRSTRFQADMVTLFCLGDGISATRRRSDHLQPIQRRLHVLRNVRWDRPLLRSVPYRQGRFVRKSLFWTGLSPAAIDRRHIFRAPCTGNSSGLPGFPRASRPTPTRSSRRMRTSCSRC